MAKNCTYKLNINNNEQVFDSERELNNYLKDAVNTNAFDSTVYSLNSKVQTAASKVNELDRLTTASKDYIKIPNYISQQHNITGKFEQFVPEYRSEERRKNTTKSWMDEGIYKEQVDADKAFNEMILHEDKMKDFGEKLHQLLYEYLKNGYSKNFTTQLNSIDDKYQEVLGIVNDTTRNLVRDTIINTSNQLNTIYTNSGGTLLPDLRIGATDYWGKKIGGRLDVIGIRKDGKLDIFDLKLSTKLFNNWDQTKLLDTGYQLAVHRQALAAAGFNVAEMTLNVIPIQMNFGDITSITSKPTLEILNKPTSRSLVGKLDYNEGSISANVKKLIPAFINISEVETTETDEKIKTSLARLFPKYKFNAQLRKDDIEDIYTKAVKTKNSQGNYQFWNEIKGETIFAKTDIELKEKITTYINSVNDGKSSRVSSLKNILERNINTKTPLENVFESKDSALNSAMMFNFEKYTNGDWRVIESDILTKAGIIGFENTDGLMEFSVFTVNNLDVLHGLGLGDSLLGLNYSNYELEKARLEIPKATTSNIEFHKTMIVLNEIPELFADGRKLSNIRVMNYRNGTSEKMYPQDLVTDFTKITTKMNINNNFNKSIKVVNVNEYVESELNSIAKTTKNDKLRDIIGIKERDDLKNYKLEQLLQMRELLLSKFPNLANYNEKTPFSYNTSEEYLYAMIGEGLLYYRGIHLKGDMAVPKYGMSFGDAQHALLAPFSYNLKDVDKYGNKVVGIGGGAKVATADRGPSLDMYQSFNLINIAFQNIRDRYNPKLGEVSDKTKNFYKAIGKSDLELMVIGNTYSIHKDFYEVMEDGSLNPHMLFKDPYNPNSSIKTVEGREYLKYMLWEINKERISGLTEEEKNTPAKDALKLEKVQKKIDRYFEVPLMRGLEVDRLRNLTTKNLWNNIKAQSSEVKNLLNPVEMSDEQYLITGGQSKNYTSMYNQFKMNPEERLRMIENHADVPGYFETNLDRITLEFIFAKYREVEVNAIIPFRQAISIVSQYEAKLSGKDISESQGIIFDKFASAVHNEKITDKELDDPLKAISLAKRVTSIAMIAFRPVLLIKELTVGSITNVIRAFTQVYGENSFNIEHLKKAYEVMLLVDKKMSRDFNIVDAVNNKYGIANLDMNVLVDKTRTDRMGLSTGLGKYMYWTNTFPDYVNRMTLFIAQMMHDETWEAHSIDNTGTLQYDFTKDKRFAEFINHRKDANYSSKTFLEQKSLYKSMIDQFNFEGKTINGKRFTYNDDLPQAYTIRDKESLKSFSDMAYGYYDHERRSLNDMTAFGIIYMQFKTYWAAKLETWFMKPVEHDKVQGKMVQKFVEVDGKQVPVWKREIYDENGNIRVEESLENDGTLEPLLTWDGNQMEGLYYSLAYTFRDISRLKFTEATSNKQRMARVTLALHDLMVAVLGGWLAYLMLESLKANKATETFQGNTINLMATSFKKATSEFDPINNIFTGFTWTPSFAANASGYVSGAKDIIFGDKTAVDYFNKNLKFMENF